MELYDDLWKAIARPPREEYDPSCLGPSYFKLQGKRYKRTDLTLLNNRGLSLECSHFEPVDEERPVNRLPCVVYLHCNSGSRLEVMPLLMVLLPIHTTVFALDFSGSGISEGDFVSFGWFERDDVRDAIDYLKQRNRTGSIILWGRSMGAVTALLHASRDPTVTALIVDSPFYSLSSLMFQIADRFPVPGFLISLLLTIVRGTILKEVGFDIEAIEPIKAAQGCQMPSMFCAASNDNIVPCNHVQELFDHYNGSKEFWLLEGDHNSQRPVYYYRAVQRFLEQYVPDLI